MGKNIVLKNARGEDVLYQDVSKITIKDTENNPATFAYVEGTLNVYENKEYDVSPYEKINVSVTDAPANSGGKYLVQIIDYDGTVLKQDYLNTGATFKLPKAPTNHERLVFQEWSSPVDITDNTITVGHSDITIGATYTTKSGLSEFDIALTKLTGLSVTLLIDGTKDWGDGTSDDLTTHTYTDYGDYMITCNGTNLNYAIFNQRESYSSKNYYCINARLANITTISSSAFYRCWSLKTITLPAGVTKISNAMCTESYSLKSITIPNGATGIETMAFYKCYSLKNVAIPSSATNLQSQLFSYCPLKSVTIPNGVTKLYNTVEYCYSLENLYLPDSVTGIDNSLCYNCYSLKSIKIPAGVTTIKSNVFASCFGITKYDMTELMVVPTLSTTGAFSSINAIAKIYVPDALYDEWIVATNWSTYADYIYKASEMPTEE